MVVTQMLNRDINSRFEDWLLSPRETLDFEVKQWLDMSDAESQGVVAKALIALENHGGGFLLFGYKENDDKSLSPDQNRPASLEPYLTDALNAIVKRRAEPPFHVEVILQRHPTSGDEYPLVRIAGTSKVPVRSDSATPGGSLKQHVYYVRAPGPESRGPLNAGEWDSLLRRVIMNQREENISLLRALLPTFATGVASQAPPTEADTLHAFAEKAKLKWNALNDALDASNQSKITHGTFSFAARIVGTSRNLDPRRILEINESARRYTGWPALVTLNHEKTRPRLVDGCIEAWLADISNPGVGYADFWRIDPKNGNFFLLRGYHEDSLDPSRFGKPGTLFELTLPVWRLGEFLLRVLDLADAMYDQPYEVLVECEWDCIAGRHLFSHNYRRHIPPYKSAESTVRTTGSFPQNVLRELLPEAVKALTKPLYEHFEFFVPPDSFFAEELSEMTKNRF
ncbi:AlbA family DNA-binding domain-containing protein [Comamonas guangdongensis]|uniref:Helix-turn-helix domain-containing protein n=1 Tax=Comamonas guangdongensis TaxID=510515 RepID=A0ABV3ZXG2_9BURK